MVILVISVVGGPIIINELYKFGNGYLTLWDASDVFLYYGTVLSAIGTITLGIIAVYQTKNANNISERLLQLEESRQRPQIDIRMITKETLKTYKKEELLNSYLHNCHTYVDDMCNLSNDGDNFWFELKNLRDFDILNILPTTVKIKIYDKNNNEVSVREHGLSNSINANILSGNAKIPFLLSLDNIWSEVYKEDDRTLGLEISFLLMNYDGVNYEQKISLEMTNAYNGDSLTPAFINKKVSKSYITV